MQAAPGLAVLHQLLVADGEERALEGAVDRQLVVGPLHGGEGGAQALHFFARVEGLAADKRWASPRASRASTKGRVTSSLKLEKRRKRRHTWRAAMGAGSPRWSRSVTCQPLSRSSQATKAATASGSEAFIAALVSSGPP